MARTIVGVLRGGSSSEYDSSLKTGAELLRALPEERFDVRDIFIDRSGLWHFRGMPADPARALSQIDVALNALHGGAGEDGTLQRMLERSGVPYAGSRVVASNVALNKILSRAILQKAGLRVPAGMSFRVQDGTTAEMASKVFVSFPPPYVVKPPLEGSSIGIRIVETIIDLPDAIGDILDAYGSTLVEEFVRGDEVSIGLIEGFRNERLYAFPPAEIVIPDSDRYLHADLYRDGGHKVVVPSNFTHEQKKQIADLARAAHQALGLSDYSSVDMKLTRRGPVFLEANAYPHLHEKAPFYHMLQSVGSSVRDFAEHAIALAQQH